MLSEVAENINNYSELQNQYRNKMKSSTKVETVKENQMEILTLELKNTVIELEKKKKKIGTE